MDISWSLFTQQPPVAICCSIMTFEEILAQTSQQNLGLRNSTTYCGVAFDLFKSGLQKCARRCEIEHVSWFCQEIYGMKHLCDPNKSTANGHLKFIAIEDVSPKCIEDFNRFYLILKDLERLFQHHLINSSRLH